MYNYLFDNNKILIINHVSKEKNFDRIDMKILRAQIFTYT